MMHASILLATLTLGEPATVASARADALCMTGLELGYNLDYNEALEAFDQAIAGDPLDGTAHRLAAATTWMRILFAQGAITVEDYLGQARATVSRRPTPTDLASRFDRHVDKAIALAEARVRTNPNDADGHFQLGAAAALRTTYIATVHGKVLESVRVGRRAYGEHKLVLALDPSRKDGALIVGMYRYTVANLSLPMRLMARLAGFESDRRSGLRLVEEAAAYPGAAQTNANLALVLMYNREGHHDRALAIIRTLQQRYPRNRLFWLEEGSAALRAGRAGEALEAIEEGLHRFTQDPRPKAYGEEAQWRFQRGAALLALGEVDRGNRELQAVVFADAPEWLRERARRLLAGARTSKGR